MSLAEVHPAAGAFDPTWTPPAPGPWMQDRAHTPAPSTRISQELYSPGFSSGFEETVRKYGALVCLVMRTVNGYTYHQVQPFDMPGPDGPPSPEQVGAEFGRRLAAATVAFEKQIWLDDLRLWDDELKPAAIGTHMSLFGTDLASLDDDHLRAHVVTCADHLSKMVYQHHRFNLAALVPVGDFLLQVSAWSGLPPTALFDALEGASPVSSLVPPELSAVVAALRADAAGRKLLSGDGDAGKRVSTLAALVPAVADYLAQTGFRLVDGFDVNRPTLSECPGVVLGKIGAALDSDEYAATARAVAFAAKVRATIPEAHQATFDDLLLQARTVYRLRDERGIYSDISAFGLLRLAMLEVGRRLTATGRLGDPTEALEAGVDELGAMIGGAATPTAADLRARAAHRADLIRSGSPRFLGPPPPDPPPVDQLPPALGRMMSADGFMLDGILNEVADPTEDGPVKGIPIGGRVYEGRARVARTFEEVFALEPGEVLVTPSTGEAFNAMIHLVGAIVTDHGSYASHAAIMARELGFPAVVGTSNGSKRIPHGAMIRVDGMSGEVTVLG